MDGMIQRVIPPEFKEFARLSREKQARYEAERREHTNRVRNSLQELRDYEVTWQRMLCEQSPINRKG